MLLEAGVSVDQSDPHNESGKVVPLSMLSVRCQGGVFRRSGPGPKKLSRWLRHVSSSTQSLRLTASITCPAGRVSTALI